MIGRGSNQGFGGIYMQKDFHFYTIYTLCRVAGFDDEKSQIVAYASQYVDDEKYGDILEFENGGRYRAVMTAHRFLDIGALSKDTFYNIFVPFHFIPGKKENASGFYEELVCTANSNIAQEMIKEAVSREEKPYFYQRLGIALHTYADTWAHQNFSGVLRDENNVKDLGFLETTVKIEALFDEAWIYAASDFIPPIGHGKAGNLPDIPYEKWTYSNYKNEKVQVHNIDRYMEASQWIYTLLCGISPSSPLCPWEKIQGRLKIAFGYGGSLEQRVDAWKYWIKKGVFYFKIESLNYDEKTWLEDAVEVVDYKTRTYRRKDNFGESNWKYYHDAALIQRFYILNELLPKYNIFCG